MVPLESSLHEEFKSVLEMALLCLCPLVYIIVLDLLQKLKLHQYRQIWYHWKTLFMRNSNLYLNLNILCNKGNIGDFVLAPSCSRSKSRTAPNLLFFKKLDKITKPTLSDVKFAADSKYVLEILISCILFEIRAFEVSNFLVWVDLDFFQIFQIHVNYTQRPS